MAKNKWQTMVDNLKESQGGGSFFFLKAGRTRVRVVPVPGTEGDEYPTFFTDTEGSFQGKVNKRRILLGIVVQAEGKEITEEDKTKVVPLLVAPSVVTQILETLAEGWDLLGANGHGITINRTGVNLGTEYSVLPSKTPIPLPQALTYPEKSLAELDEEYRHLNNDDKRS